MQPISDEVLAEIVEATGEDPQIVRDLWDALQCCGNEPEED